MMFIGTEKRRYTAGVIKGAGCCCVCIKCCQRNGHADVTCKKEDHQVRLKSSVFGGCWLQ